MGILTGLAYTPYALPTFAACCALLFLLACLIKLSGHSIPWRWLWLGAAIAGFASVTLTVDPQMSWKNGARVCSFAVAEFPRLGIFTDTQQRVLNTLIALPLGFFASLIRTRAGRVGAALIVLALPLAVEFTQYYARRINRNCDATDAFDNLTGVVAGLIVGSLVFWIAQWITLLTRRARRN
ncbi:VanZ family protein [Micrococcales bacterium 31B]|nr:VanZ family protein [Micrococcales bacterium 31B]